MSLENFKNAGKQILASVRRQNARKTARAKSDTLLEDGYRFLASVNGNTSRPGIISVLRPGEETVAYEIELFRDPATGAMTYSCPCGFFQEEERICPGGGWCKHTRRLRKEFRVWVPLVKSALAAPAPTAIPPQNFATALNERPARKAGESYPGYPRFAEPLVQPPVKLPRGVHRIRVNKDGDCLRWAWEN